jgi:hypothetical protein
MSITAHGWFIADIGALDLADKIGETLEPIFREEFCKHVGEVAAVVKENPAATWGDTPCRIRSIINSHLNEVAVIPYSHSSSERSTHLDDIAEQLYRHMSALYETPGKTGRADIFYEAPILKGPARNQTVFSVKSKCEAYQKTPNTQSWCRDYSYWDNTDPDENVPADEWGRRGRYWNSVPYSEIVDTRLAVKHPSELLTVVAFCDV